ncbi:MAG: hypothetical protein ABIH74_03305 [Candidatus Omnitrophota bacterium]
MSIIDKVKQLTGPMFFLFVFSKVIIGIGIGVLIAGNLLPGSGWWILTGGVILSILPAVKIFCGK